MLSEEDASSDDAVSEPLRILLADDHALFRRGLREVLEEDGIFRVVAEAGDGEEAVRLAGQLGTAGLDLVLMDLEMPKLSGVGATRRILGEVPGLRVVVLTASVQDTDLFVAVDTGAAGFLNKTMHPDALVRTLEDFCRTGGLAMTRVTAAKTVGYLQRRMTGQQPASVEAAPPDPPAARPSINDLLSPREQEVAALLTEGATNRQIAERLTISAYTAKEYVQNVVRKLGARDRVEAAVRYRELRS